MVIAVYLAARRRTAATPRAAKAYRPAAKARVAAGDRPYSPPESSPSPHLQRPPLAGTGVAVPAALGSTPSLSPDLPKIAYDEDADIDPTLLGTRESKRPTYSPPTQRIIYDEDAADDEPTHSGAMILVTATAQTDKGARRKRNEDSVLAREEQGIFVVADGMGGYRGGEIASQLAVTTIDRAFATKSFDGPVHDTIPPRASELARAIQMANEAIFEKASGDKLLEGMGTTISAARFSANKQRVYIGHVGDSRVYLLRGGKLRQMTSDHTMQQLGVTGSGAAHLSRAVGVWPVVPIDIVLGKPKPGDMYLLCSDGLSKMVSDARIEELLRGSATPEVAAERLVSAANESGGKDNISVIVVRVDDPAKSNRPRAAA